MTMTHHTTKRTHELQVIATQIVMTSGADLSQAVAIKPLAKAMAKISGCAYQTAIRHIERAILRARNELKPGN